VYAF
jgi:hypothetical protein